MSNKKYYEIEKYGENFNQIGDSFKKTQKNLNHIQENMTNIIDKNTSKQKKELEKAIENYNVALKETYETQEMKLLEEKYNSNLDKAQKQLKQALTAFSKIKLDIINKCKLENKENEIGPKVQYLYECILKKLYDKDVIEQFKNNVVIVMDNPLNNKLIK